MQTASAPFHTPPPQNGYQPLSGRFSNVQARSSVNLTPPKTVPDAEIYAIKRQYLELLPPQQSSVWPYDIRAAIATILAQKTQALQSQTPSKSGTPSKTFASAPDANGVSDTTPPQASSSQRQSTPAPSQAGQPASTSSASQPTTSQSQAPPAAPGPHYPHQSYYHPTYPHAPYYTTPHGTYGYPPPYPSYPQPPGMYPVNPASHHPPLFTNTPLPPPASEPPPPPHNNIDDLPSYEEMIVEALLDSGDPEGCAPKTLFNWMSTHYPLQMNFRPSASQALQKAYKRGRLEKGNNGKYRPNENWEGGAVYFQADNASPANACTDDTTWPATTFVVAIYPDTACSSRSYLTCKRVFLPGQSPGYGGYPFGYPYPGALGPTQPSVGRDGSALTSQKQPVDAIDHETGEGSDAWEAAQNILQAINFGQLIQISN
ncbi:hypothetical protein JVU11DRAFT_3471 [Chiua virens]|nr:hypothetical protein JVU11DRAFT_3471 [Chiua virens]